MLLNENQLYTGVPSLILCTHSHFSTPTIWYYKAGELFTFVRDYKGMYNGREGTLSLIPPHHLELTKI
jgi:hypothetical protein